MTALTDVQIRAARTEYMRRYRTRKGGAADADRAQHRARTLAIKWIRHHRPELWQQFLDEAWQHIRPDGNQ